MSHHPQLDADLIVRDMEEKIASLEKEVKRLRDLYEPPRFKCSCVIEMASFRHKGGTCLHCGGIIG